MKVLMTDFRKEQENVFNIAGFTDMTHKEKEADVVINTIAC